MPPTGLLFAPGVPSAGATVAFVANAFGLSFEGEHGRLGTIAWNQMQWRRGGFNNSQLLLEWSSANEGCSLAISDPAGQQAVLSYLDVTQQQAHPAARGTRRWMLAMVGAFVVLPLFLIALLILQAGNLADWAVAKIPVETEKELGAKAFAHYRATAPLQETHPALPMLRELGARMTKGSAYQYQFHIVKSDSINAFAMPGGYLVFHTALLEKADRAEEVAGVLAHEIQHVERRHGLRGFVYSAGWRLALTLMLGDTGASAAISLAENLGNLHFSRSQETDADMGGVKALIDADIDPRGMATFFRKLARESGKIPAILSSHPASEERFEKVEQAIPTDRQFVPLPYDIIQLTRRP